MAWTQTFWNPRHPRRHDRLLVGRLLVGLLAALVVSPGCSWTGKRGDSSNVLSARQLALQGQTAIGRGKWDTAESLLREAIEQCPVEEQAHYHYGRTLWHRGARQEAIHHLEEAVRLSAGNPPFLVELGRMYLASGDLVRAEQRAEQAITAQRQLATAWALRGDVQRAQGRLDEALSSYHRALSLEDDLPGVQLEVAEIYRRQGRPRRALATLNSLLDQYNAHHDPVPPKVLFLQGLAYKELGRFHTAVEVFNVASRQSPSDANLLYHLAESQLLAGDPGIARLAALEALQKAPGHAACQQLLDRINQAQQDVTAAITHP